jgi:hypothetical protein
MPQEYDELPFQIDHVLALQHGGPTTPANTCLACAVCNRYKGPNLSSIDPRTSRVVRLFHPRRLRWERHFLWNGVILEGRTQAGRATVSLLQINSEQRVALRTLLLAEGVFPQRFV